MEDVGTVQRLKRAMRHTVVRFIRCAIQNFSEAIEKNISDSQWESDKQRLLKLIDSRGPSGIAKSELTRRTQWVKDGKIRDSYLSDMQDGGMIIFGTNPNNLKSKQGWLWTRKHGRKAMLKKTNKGNRGMNKQIEKE